MISVVRNKTNRSVIALRISEQRTALSFTQKQAAAKIGIPRSTYAGYESGQREPSAERLQRIAELYRTSVDYLIGRTDEPTPSGASVSENDMKRIMNRQLHWDGVPLTDEDKRPIIELLELIAKERLKN